MKTGYVDFVKSRMTYFFCARSSRFAAAENYGTRRGQGGVAILWKRSLQGASEIKEIISDRICGLRLQTSRGGILNIISVYMPSAGSPEDYATVLDELDEILSSREKGSISIVGGDVNGDFGNIEGSRGKRAPSKQGLLLYGLLKNYNLFACNLDDIVEGPVDTHQGPTGSSAIDYMMVPEVIRNHVVSCLVSDNHPLNASDHESVQITLKVETIRSFATKVLKGRVIQWSKLSEDDIVRVYTSIVEDKLSVLIGTLPNAKLSGEYIDTLFDQIIDILTKAANNIPTTKPRKNSKPFWNSKLKELKGIKVKKFNSWKEAGRPRDPDNPVWQEHKVAKKEFSQEIRKVSKQYENEQVVRAVQA